MTPSGIYIAYTSLSTTLVQDVKLANFNVYRWNSLTNKTELVSIDTTAKQSGNANSGTSQYYYDFSIGSIVMSPDGRFIAFASQATNLTSDDSGSSGQVNPVNKRNVFVRDLQLGTTTLVSKNGAGQASGNAGSFSPAMSADGKVIVFESNATDLVSGLSDANFSGSLYSGLDVYVRDLTANQTTLVSIMSELLPRQLPSDAGITQIDDVTPDGRFVLFNSSSQRLTPDVPNNAWFRTNEYLLDRQTSQYEMITRRPNGDAGNLGRPAQLSADGRYVAFISPDSLDTTHGTTQGGFYLLDRQTNKITLINRNTSTNAGPNAAPGNAEIAISSDGRYVAFVNASTNLVNGISTSGNNLYIYDRTIDTTKLVNVNASGTASGNNGHGNFFPRFSKDGSVLVFVTNSSDLVSGITDTNNENDVFAYFTTTGTLKLVSVSVSGTEASNAAAGYYHSDRPQVSDNGRYVVFASQSTNLTSLATSGSQVFRRDLITNLTELVSVNVGSTGGANRQATSAFLSGDGSKVLFES